MMSGQADKVFCIALVRDFLRSNGLDATLRELEKETISIIASEVKQRSQQPAENPNTTNSASYWYDGLRRINYTQIQREHLDSGGSKGECTLQVIVQKLCRERTKNDSLKQRSKRKIAKKSTEIPPLHSQASILRIGKNAFQRNCIPATETPIRNADVRDEDFNIAQDVLDQVDTADLAEMDDSVVISSEVYKALLETAIGIPLHLERFGDRATICRLQNSEAKASKLAASATRHAKQVFENGKKKGTTSKSQHPGESQSVEEMEKRFRRLNKLNAAKANKATKVTETAPVCEKPSHDNQSANLSESSEMETPVSNNSRPSSSHGSATEVVKRNSVSADDEERQQLVKRLGLGKATHSTPVDVSGLLTMKKLCKLRSNQHWIPSTMRNRMLQRDLKITKTNIEQQERWIKEWRREKARNVRMLGNKGDIVQPKEQDCALCTKTFYVEQLPMSISNKAIVDLRLSWGVMTTDPGIVKVPRCYDTTKVCCFCSQFFIESGNYRPQNIFSEVVVEVPKEQENSVPQSREGEQ